MTTRQRQLEFHGNTKLSRSPSVCCVLNELRETSKDLSRCWSWSEKKNQIELLGSLGTYPQIPYDSIRKKEQSREKSLKTFSSMKSNCCCTMLSEE